MQVAKLIKQDWPNKNFGSKQLLKYFITTVLEYKAGLNTRSKFVCIAICSLMMSLCSRDLGLTYTAPGFWMVKHHPVCIGF